MNVFHWITGFAILWLACFVCCGCTLPPVEYLPGEEEAIKAAGAGWTGAGFERCTKLDALAVAYVWAPCGNRNSADCVQMRGRRQTIMVREGQPIVDDQGGPVVHGALHVCEGNTADGEAHNNPKVWIRTGGDSSAQGRARAILRPPTSGN